MAKKIRLDIVSSEGQIFSGDVASVIAPGEQGELGIYPGHAPLLTRLDPGSVRYRLNTYASETDVYVSGGILEIQPDIVCILSDIAIRAQDLDEQRVNAAIEAAKTHLAKSHHDSIDYAQAQAELAQAVAQLATLRKSRHAHTLYHASSVSQH